MHKQRPHIPIIYVYIRKHYYMYIFTEYKIHTGCVRMKNETMWHWMFVGEFLISKDNRHCSFNQLVSKVHHVWCRTEHNMDFDYYVLSLLDIRVDTCIFLVVAIWYTFPFFFVFYKTLFSGNGDQWTRETSNFYTWNV